MSMIYLGDASQLGIGTQVDLPQTEYWYRRAASGNAPIGLHELGSFLLERSVIRKRWSLPRRGREVLFAIARDAWLDVYEWRRCRKRCHGGANAFGKRNGSRNVFAKCRLAILLLRESLGFARLRGAWLFLTAFWDVLVVV